MSSRDILSLVPVFDAIMSERNLSKAAQRLGVTQSAVSQALARLRALAGDDLFERTGRGVRPTPRALEMSGHVQAALTHVSAAFAPKSINVHTLQRTFVLDIGAGFDALILPALVEELSRRAPGVRLVVSNTRGSDLLNELKFGETEIAFDFQSSDAPGIRSQLVGRGSAVALARPGHPALKKGMTKELYLELPHVALAWARAPAVSGVAKEQGRIGLEPKVAVSVPTLMTLGAVVSSSNLIATTSAVVGTLLEERYQLQTFPLPFRFPPLTLYQLWHARFDGDAAHSWLRETIKALSERVVRERKELAL